MAGFVRGLFLYALLPGVTLTIFVATGWLAVKAPPKFALPARAGFFAGIVAFTIYVVTSSSSPVGLNVIVGQAPPFDWVALLVGLLVGFGGPFVAQLTLFRQSLYGLIMVTMATASSVALFSYFFDSPLRGFSLYFTMFALLGALMHVALLPSEIKRILREEGIFIPAWLEEEDSRSYGTG